MVSPISALLKVLAKSPLPLVKDQQLCYGETLIIEALEEQNLFWFSDKNLKNLVGQGKALILEDVKTSLILFAVNYTLDLPSNPTEVFVSLENPLADFSITKIDDHTVRLEAYDPTLPQHQWEINDNLKFSGPEVIYTLEPGAVIPVKLAVENNLGCISEKMDSIATPKMDLVLSTEEAIKSLISEISIHPNPSSAVFQVVMKEAISNPVMDQAGRLIQKSEFGYYSNRLTIDLSHVRKGTYILNISSGVQQEFKRVVLQ